MGLSIRIKTKKTMKTLKNFGYLLAALVTVWAMPATAQAPQPWQLNLQEAATPMAKRMGDFHDMLLWIIAAIALFVLVLLVWVVIRYNSKVNPEPSQFTHNVLIEVLWTVIPVAILVVIAIPSFQLLYYQDRIEEPDMTLKVTGRQWYWDYEYPDHEGIAFSSYALAEDEIDPAKNQIRLLSTDNVVVLPVDTNIQILMTGGDVIHSWTVPAFGVKIDAIPGRLNETWVRIEKPGTYYGQCSEICGKDHAFMPIEVRAVTKEEFEQWLVTAKEEFASIDAGFQPIRTALLQE